MTLAPAPPQTGEGDEADKGDEAVAVEPATTAKVRLGWLRRRRRSGLALLAGTMLGVAFPPLGLWPLAPLGAGLLPLAVRGARARTSAGLGFLACLVYFLLTLHFTAYAGADAWIALSIIEAALMAPIGILFMLVQRLRGAPFWCAAVWVVAEAFRGRAPFGGFPWARIAFSQVDGPLVRFAALGGAPLVTAVAALCGAALVTAVVARRPLWLVAVAVPVLAAFAIPVPTAGQAVGSSPASTVVAVIQGNVPRLGLDFNSQRAAVLDNHVTATLQLAADVAAGRRPAPDIVIWPENSSDLDPFTEPDAAVAIQGAVDAINRPVLVGAVLDGPGPNYVSNAGLVYTPAGFTGEKYVKRHPVPFGEYVPFRAELTKVISRLADKIPRDFIHGSGTGALNLGPVRVGDVICFEVAYDALVRTGVTDGGRLLAVQTNNATFGHSNEAAQQLQMTRLRTIEHGRAAVVASTSGISAIVMPDGTVTQQTPIFTRAVLEQRLPLRSTLTVADRVGSWPEAVLVVLGLLGAGIGTGMGVATRRRARA